MKSAKFAITSLMIWMLIAVSGVLFEASAATIYSAAGGDWSNTGTWTGGVVPGSGDTAIIQDFHNVTISSDVTVAGLTLTANTFTALTVNASTTLTVTNDLTLTSGSGCFANTIQCNGDLSVGGDIHLDAYSDPATAAIKMGANTNITLGGSISFGNAGTIYAPSNNYYTFTYNGSSAQTITCNDNIIYNHLILNNSNGFTLDGNLNTTRLLGQLELQSGSLTPSSNTITGTTDSVFTLNNGTTLTLSGTAGLPSGFTYSIGSTASIYFSGTSQTIAAETYGNLVINCSGTATLAGNITVGNNLTVASGTLDVTASNYDIDLQGNWVNTGGSFTARSAQVTFSGSSAQSITSNGQSFYDLIINNSHALGVALNDDVTASNSITMTDGLVVTGSNTLILTNSSASSLSGYSSASFVYGNLRRYVTSNTNTYGFPVGNGYNTTNYFLADLINGNLSGTSYITAYFGTLTNSDNADLTASDAYITYQSIDPDGVWFLTPNSQPSSGTYDIKLYITNFNQAWLTDNEFGPLKRADNSTTAADWSDGGGTMNADNGSGRLKSDGYALRMGLSSFSQFGIGRASVTGNPLPITLIDFNGRLTDNKTVALNWTTAVEINNNYFTIERSTDGENFEAIDQIDGAGNSNITKSYSTFDLTPAQGINYYRLKQTDFDGGFEYSDIIAVTIEAATPEVANIYPNPANIGGNLTISFNIPNEDRTVQLNMYDLTGKLIFETSMEGTRPVVNIPSHVPAGIYMLNLVSGSNIQSERLLIQ